MSSSFTVAKVGTPSGLGMSGVKAKDNTTTYIAIALITLLCCCLLSSLAAGLYYYFSSSDPCACINGKEFGQTCGDPDKSGFNWCYVANPTQCKDVAVTKSQNSDQYWKRC